MRIVLVSYMGYDGPGVMHAHHFANLMVETGHQVMMLLNGDPATASLMAESPRYGLEEISFRRGLLAPALRRQIERFAPDIVHLWTPRHIPARAGLEVWQTSDAHLVIHYEDDEEFILEHFGGGHRFAHDDVGLYRFFGADRLDPERLDAMVAGTDNAFLRKTLLQPTAWNWLHPVVSPIAEKLATGYTCISASYTECLAKRSSKPVLLLLPGVDTDRFQPRDKPPDLVSELRLEGRLVLLYSGAIADIHDFSSYLRALPAIVRAHPEVVVVQIGRNHIPDLTADLVRRGDLTGHVRFIDQVPHSRMPDYLALADAFLAHVRADRFNAHRLPSKIPEYMAMGCPMLVVDHGFGTELAADAEAVKVSGDDEAELAAGLRRLLERRPSWAQMGERLRRRATELFDWRRNTAALTDFYAEILRARQPATSEGRGKEAREATLGDLGWRPPRPAGAAAGPARRKRVVIMTDGRVGEKMGGTGIRYLGIARALADDFDVALGHRHEDHPRSDRLEVFTWSPDDPVAAVERALGADVVLTHGFVLEKLPHLRQAEGRLVVDLYCPFIFENLDLHRDRGLDLADRGAIHRNDMRVLLEQLALGDHFLCANERQRDWVLGMLTALDRIGPRAGDRRHHPDEWVSVVPIGLFEEPSVHAGEPVIKGVWPGIDEDDLLLIWGGGIWSWLDPLTPIRAMKTVTRHRSDVKLAFLSTRAAETDLVGMPLREQARALARELGVLDRSVFFNQRSYVDFETRGGYFIEADIGICAHFRSLETHFSFRTRVLDYLNFGLPILTSEGDYFGAYVERHGLGRAVAIDDPEAWAQAILELAEDPELRARCAERALEHRGRFAWSRVAEPLIDYCHREEADERPGARSMLALRRAAAPASAPGRVGGDRLTEDALRQTPLDDLAAEAVTRVAALRDRCFELDSQVHELEADRKRILNVLGVMSVQVNLIRKIPFASSIWRLIRRLRYPHLRG